MKRIHTFILTACVALVGCPQGSSQTGQGSAPSADGGHPRPLPTARGDRGGDLPRLANVEVAAGPFVMGSEGSTHGGQDIERPRAERLLGKACYLDRCEVTNAAYAKFLASPELKRHRFCHTEEPKNKDHTPAKATAEERTWGAVPDPFGAPGRGDHPVVGVDWYDAYAFAAWMGRRLPSEEEFEKAARGAEGRKFPWGDGPLREGQVVRANGYGGKDGHRMTAPVGAFPQGAASCGALDLAGNVWEWTSSNFYTYEGAPEGTEEDGSLLVIRGGGWNSPTSFLMRGAMRVARPPSYRSAALGFRTVSDEHVPPRGER